ncbi:MULTISPECIES: monovalent cation/H(+) antiporter subunit G [Methylobacterium]|uniref:Cation:proton antiporter n=1 Tax=Methylobacterium thuringiense TaxID=1003091 RepID=A0ABQ4THD2_9HYPH|nr:MULTISPECIES: monovalent cation/H(+) antiporter subunit G [Methylobacterium]TXN24786.1 cation:proton antiporter [Methylobacterium sp. WL9]GJE54234.1 hypothetical protein EKPJFOCH_0708 [Methylobacterium thuringiense]
MSPGDLPDWAAWLVSALALAGAGISLVGAVGLIRLKTFYERVHAPTLGATLGMAMILAASIVYFSAADGRPVLRDLLIGLFLTVTTPITLILLGRAAAYRDRSDGNANAPPDP